mmetsp:Transcript_14058/g.35804  ORF Transcript_14058/g.35804 Transcript_14058/m.35804 type:complete len:128 (-) Transcript_14058:749-1132(-)
MGSLDSLKEELESRNVKTSPELPEAWAMLGPWPPRLKIEHARDFIFSVSDMNGGTSMSAISMQMFVASSISRLDWVVARISAREPGRAASRFAALLRELLGERPADKVPHPVRGDNDHAARRRQRDG